MAALADFRNFIYYSAVGARLRAMENRGEIEDALALACLQFRDEDRDVRPFGEESST
jgi:hypothetical protein